MSATTPIETPSHIEVINYTNTSVPESLAIVERVIFSDVFGADYYKFVNTPVPSDDSSCPEDRRMWPDVHHLPAGWKIGVRRLARLKSVSQYSIPAFIERHGTENSKGDALGYLRLLFKQYYDVRSHLEVTAHVRDIYSYILKRRRVLNEFAMDSLSPFFLRTDNLTKLYTKSCEDVKAIYTLWVKNLQPELEKAFTSLYKTWEETSEFWIHGCLDFPDEVRREVLATLVGSEAYFNELTRFFRRTGAVVPAAYDFAHYLTQDQRYWL